MLVIRKEHVSDDLKKFIREQIRTVLRLEVLLLLYRNQPKSFSSEEIAAELGFEDDVAQEQLPALAEIGILATSGAGGANFSYDPTTEKVRNMVSQLALTYTTQRVMILSLILSEGPDRIRIFAEAIKLLRGKD